VLFRSLHAKQYIYVPASQNVHFCFAAAAYTLAHTCCTVRLCCISVLQAGLQLCCKLSCEKAKPCAYHNLGLSRLHRSRSFRSYFCSTLPAPPATCSCCCHYTVCTCVYCNPLPLTAVLRTCWPGHGRSALLRHF
jgi:hypothetical protein